MIVIFILSSKQGIVVTDEYAVNFIVFKTLHIMEYALLYILFYRALSEGKKDRKHNALKIAYILTILYAASDEIHQTFVPTREGTIRDGIIDSIGASLSWIFLTTLLPKIPTKLKHLAANLQII